MKIAILMIGLVVLTNAFAVEVPTDCPAMNERTREKIVKTNQLKPKIKASTSSAQ